MRRAYARYLVPVKDTVPLSVIKAPVARSLKPLYMAGLTKNATGELSAPTLKSFAGVKFAVYLAALVTIGWNMRPKNFPEFGVP